MNKQQNEDLSKINLKIERIESIIKVLINDVNKLKTMIRFTNDKS